MPTNRNAQLRYNVIDRCLRNRGRKWTWIDILNEVNNALLEDNPNSKGIGKTTLYEDLKDIEYRVYEGEIERIKSDENKKTIYLRYTDPNYSISNQPLNEEETNQLKSAIQILSRFKGLPQFEWINEIIPTIESKLGLVRTDTEVIAFESNIDYEGLAYIPILFNLIIQKRAGNIYYQDFKSEIPYLIEFHPYFLKQYNSRWFIIGLNPTKDFKIQTLALDRIKSVTESDKLYIPDSTDWEDYFSEFIGVTKMNSEPQKIKLRIMDDEQAAYIRTKPLHQSQKTLRKKDEFYETEITVIPNYELEKLLLSYGDRIQILEPQELRIKLAYRFMKACQMYKDH